MIVGEDVDLIWRLAAVGRIRYLPDVRVGHRPRGSLVAALNRRRLYGTSAADLGQRHPGALRHVDVSVWSFGPWLLAVFIHPLAGLLAAAAGAALAPWGMPGLSATHARRLAVQGHRRAGGALGRWLVRPMLPVTLAVVVAAPRLRGRLLLAAAAGFSYVVAMDVRSGRTHLLIGEGGPVGHRVFAGQGSGRCCLLRGLARSAPQADSRTRAAQSSGLTVTPQVAAGTPIG